MIGGVSLNKKFKKAIQDSFVSPEAKRKEQFFTEAEHLLQQKRRKTPLLYRIAAGAAAVTAAFGVGVYLRDMPSPQPVHQSDPAVITDTATQTSAAETTNKPALTTTQAHPHTTAPSSTTKKASAASTAQTTITATSSANSISIYTTSSPIQQVDMPAEQDDGGQPQTTVTPPVETTVTTTITIKEDQDMKFNRMTAILTAFFTAFPNGLASVAADEQEPAIRNAISWIETNEALFDFNGNGDIDLDDLYTELVYTNGELDELTEEQIEKCRAVEDFDKNGEVTPDESVYLFSYATEKGNIVNDFDLDLISRSRFNYGSNEVFLVFRSSINEFVRVAQSQATKEFNSFKENVENGTYDMDVNLDGKVDIYDFYDWYLYYYSTYSPIAYRAIKDPTVIGLARDLPIWTNGTAVEAVGKAIDDNDYFRDICTLPSDVYDKSKALQKAMMDNGIVGMNSYANVLQYFCVEVMNGEVPREYEEADFYADYREVFTLSDGRVLRPDYYKSLEYGNSSEKPEDYYYTENSVNTFINRMPEFKDLFIPVIHSGNSKEQLDKINENSYAISDELYNISEVAKRYSELKDGIQSGKRTLDSFDINLDGKFDRNDVLTAVTIYNTEKSTNTSYKRSILPYDVWERLEHDMDLDNNHESSSKYDLMLLELLNFEFGETNFRGISDLDIYNPFNPATTELLKECTAALQPKTTNGDVDLDGKITAIDATKVLTYYSQVSAEAKIAAKEQDKLEALGDINDDGMVDGRDATELLSIYAKNSVE